MENKKWKHFNYIEYNVCISQIPIPRNCFTVEKPLEKNTRYGHSTFKYYLMIQLQLYSMNAIDWQESNRIDN